MKLLYAFLPFFSLTLFSCNNTAETTDKNTQDSVASDGQFSSMLVKTADLEIKVKDVETTAEQVSALAREAAGLITDMSILSDGEQQKRLRLSQDSILVVSSFTPHGRITARVPSGKLEEFINATRRLGYRTQQSSLHMDDKSLAFLQHTLQQEARAQSLKPASRVTTTTIQQSVALKDEAIDQLIANKTIERDVAYSTIVLGLSQNPRVTKEVMADHEVSNYKLPFSRRIADAIGEGWAFFVGILIALAHLWPFLLIASCGYILYRYRLKNLMAVRTTK